MTISSNRRDPTDDEIHQYVREFIGQIRDGWTPDLETRLRFGLTADVLKAIRGMPDEKDVCEYG